VPAKSKPNVAAVIKRFIWLLLFLVFAKNKKARAPPNCWRNTGLWVRDLWPLGIFNYVVFSSIYPLFASSFSPPEVK